MFHKWPLNGYVHKIHHGDWFGGKGVGLCKIKVRNMNINVYIAHVRLSNALFRYSLMILNYALSVTHLRDILDCSKFFRFLKEHTHFYKQN